MCGASIIFSKTTYLDCQINAPNSNTVITSTFLRTQTGSMEKVKTILGSDAFEALNKANIQSLQSLLLASPLDLEDITDLPKEKLNEAQILCAEEILRGKIQTADNIPSWKRIKSGCKGIDSLLKGGFPINGICEIVGRSGVGKTQLALQLALNIQLSEEFGGNEKEVVYICTETPFPTKRLHSLSELYNSKYDLQNYNFEDHVYITQVEDSVSLRKCLKAELPAFLKGKNVGLVIIDSIAGVFRSDTENPDYVSRSSELRNISAALNQIQDEYKCAIVIINQVADNLETGDSEPCLGLAWANNITCRFTMTRIAESPIRKFVISFAPHLPSKSTDIAITSHGVVDSSDL